MPTFIALGYASPAGQARAIGNLGRGTRLVLEMLGVVTADQDELTARGRRLVQDVAANPAAASLKGPFAYGRHLRVRGVARVIATRGLRAVQSPDEGFAIATYRLEDEESRRDEDVPLIEVTATNQGLLILRGADDAEVKVIDAETMSELARDGSVPLLVATSGECAPSSLLRRRLVLADAHTESVVGAGPAS